MTSAPTFVTVDNAPRNLEELTTKVLRSARLRLAMQINLLPTTDAELAFVSCSDAQQAEALLQGLLAVDAQRGGQVVHQPQQSPQPDNQQQVPMQMPPGQQPMQAPAQQPQQAWSPPMPNVVPPPQPGMAPPGIPQGPPQGGFMPQPQPNMLPAFPMPGQQGFAPQQPQQGFGQPQQGMGFGQPGPAMGAPPMGAPQGFGPPMVGGGQPQQGFAPPQQNFAPAPPQGFGPPPGGPGGFAPPSFGGPPMGAPQMGPPMGAPSMAPQQGFAPAPQAAVTLPQGAIEELLRALKAATESNLQLLQAVHQKQQTLEAESAVNTRRLEFLIRTNLWFISGMKGPDGQPMQVEGLAQHVQHLDIGVVDRVLQQLHGAQPGKG